MAVASEVAGLGPVNAIALVGALGVGSQWLAWRLRMPAIVLMLLAGLIVGPGLGIFDPARDIGPLMKPMISIAVAIILFEGGLTLDFHSLREARVGVRRLVFIGAPLGWALSAAALHYTAGLGWAASSVFGGIMVVTGPTVIAPLLRQARLQQRPAKLLQWEAIVNDPVGALAAVLAFTVVLVMADTATVGEAVTEFSLGIGVATILGLAAGWGIAQGFTRGVVPEYMKVPVLFTVLVAVFAASDAVLHESGLLAVTVMGVVIANAELPSYDELRRFKEHATVLLVSGVFILLAANMDRDTLFAMEWSTLGFIIVVILLARPVTVMVSLLGSDVPMKERILIALTGPRGVVLVAVAGLFAERLVELGYDDASKIPALAFALVAATVVLHGFTLAPLAGWLGLTADRASGVLIVGGSRWSTALAKALQDAEMPVLVVDRNRSRLRSAREAGVRTYYGDILSEDAHNTLDLVPFEKVIAATDNDAYNTLVATDLAPEFGRENVWQIARSREESRRHTLPVTLGGRELGSGRTHRELSSLMLQGWRFSRTNLTDDYTLEQWEADRPDGVPMMELFENGSVRLLGPEHPPREKSGVTLLAMLPPKEDSATRD